MRTGLLALALLTAGCTPQHDAEDAGLRFMMLMKKASGGPALDSPQAFYETGSVSLGDHTRLYETWGDFHALRTVSIMTRADGVSMTNGFDGEMAWQIGPDGTVITDDSPAAVAGARLGAYLTVGGYFYPDRFPASFAYTGRKEAGGIAYDVVTVTPEGAAPVDFWLNTENHRLQRMTGMDGGTPFEGVVNRYDVYEGVSIPVDLTQTIDGDTLSHKVKTYMFTEVPAEMFAPPQPAE